MGNHSAGRGAHSPRGRALRRRRRKRATRLAAASGTSLAAVAVFAFSPMSPAFPGGDGERPAAVAVVTQADAPPATAAPAPAVPVAPVVATLTSPAKAASKAAPKPAPEPEPKADSKPPPAVESLGGVDLGPAFTKKGLLKIPSAASGHYVVAAGRDKPAGPGDVVRYMVEVEEGLPFDVDAFAADVHRILNAPGGWGKGGTKLRFVRVDDGPARFRVALSSPDLTDRQCAPLRTYGKVSCFNGVRSVINARRWAHGSPTYGADLAGYRNYVISHEVGHAMGKGHVSCPAPGAAAPVMVQQTKSLEGCAANPWPFPARAEPPSVIAAG